MSDVAPQQEVVVSVPVDVEMSYVVGRNGTYSATALQAHLGATGRVEIAAIGKRGRAIRGGVSVRPVQAMDQLCERWLRRRGLWPAQSADGEQQ